DLVTGPQDRLGGQAHTGQDRAVHAPQVEHGDLGRTACVGRRKHQMATRHTGVTEDHAGALTSDLDRLTNLEVDRCAPRLADDDDREHTSTIEERLDSVGAVILRRQAWADMTDADRSALFARGL